MTYQEIQDHLAGMIHGGSVSKVTNLLSLVHRASKNVVSRIDAPSTKRVVNLANSIHDDVFDYTAPSDFKRIIDLRPQVNRTLADNPSLASAKTFDLYKSMEDGRVSIKDNGGTKSIRINFNITPTPVTINDSNTLTSNGAWSAVASAANLGVSNQFFASGGASIEFDVVASGDGIENTSMTAVDLTDHDEVSQLFAWVYFPTASSVTSVTLIWGNDTSTNYWTGVAQTAQFDGTAFRDGWNLVSFDWSAATETGTVAPATIDSLRITIASTAQNNVRVDRIWSSIGEIWEIEYYSKFLWRTSAGVFEEKPSADSSVLNLDEEGEMIFLNELGLLASQQLQGQDMTQDRSFFENELYGTGSRKGLYRQFKQRYPSEALKLKTFYYRINGN